jgi:hypothetical protein
MQSHRIENRRQDAQLLTQLKRCDTEDPENFDQSDRRNAPDDPNVVDRIATGTYFNR